MQTAFRPYFRRPFLLTKAEQRFYEILRDIVHGHTVFAKVRLADLIDAHEWHYDHDTNFYRVCAKHIDFLICDAASRPRVAVELDDASHQRPERKARDREFDQLFKAVCFPLLRVRVQRHYDVADIARRLLTKFKPRR
jgi:hypothetical protein